MSLEKAIRRQDEPTNELLRAPPVVLVARTRFVTDVENRPNVTESINPLPMNCNFIKRSLTSVTSLRGGQNSPGTAVLSSNFCTTPEDEKALSADFVQHVTLYSSNDVITAEGQQRFKIPGRIKLSTKDNPSTVSGQPFAAKPAMKLKPVALPKQFILSKNKFHFKVICSVTRGSTHVMTTNDLRQGIKAEEEVLINGKRVQISRNTSEWTSCKILLMQDWPVSVNASLIL